MKSSRINRFGNPAIIVTLFMAVLILVGCGKKAPPKVPLPVPLPVVADLTGVVQGDAVALTWSVPQKGGRTDSDVAGFYVLRSKTALADAGCKDCPLLFERTTDIPLERAVKGDAAAPGVTHVESLEKGYRYLFKVNVYTPADMTGGDSNLVEILH